MTYCRLLVRSMADRSGKADGITYVTGHAPQRLPFLFFAEHRWDIVQLLAIYRFSLFNGRGGLSTSRAGHSSLFPCLHHDAKESARNSIVVHIVVHNSFA
jgi:hypothetical protein